MRILLVNDDGIHANGIKTIENIARQLSDDVWIIAPEKNHSGAGHSLTLSEPIRIRKISEKKFAVDGTPTDCVFVACNHIMHEAHPDLVLSGVNYGPNLAEDVTYSGTVAAAMEACLFKIPSIAFSLAVIPFEENAYWKTAEDHCVQVVKTLLSANRPESVFYNVNIPNITTGSIKGVKITYQGQRRVDSVLEERVDPRGQSYFWVGGIHHEPHHQEGTDLNAIEHGYISVTPLSIDLTDTPTVLHLQKVFEG